MKVCILGSGLSSLTLAKALVNENIYVDIFATNRRKIIKHSRTLGISKSNVEYFNKNIINIKKIAWELKKIQIFTDNLENEKILNFQNNNNQLFSILKNFQLYQLLDKNLSKNKFCKKIYLKDKDINFKHYNLIITTDHDHSLVKKFFSRKIEKKYKSIAYTTIIKHEKIFNNVATQIFTKKGPIAFLPISDYETSIVYSLNKSKLTKNDNILDLIHKYNFKYKIKKINDLSSFELISINLRSYYHENILAFGDILHRIHPLAGQGFNMTIRDTKILIKIIKEKIKLGLPLDSSINQEFEKNLKHRNFIFSNTIDLIYEFFNFERKLNNNFLSKSVKFLGKNTSINKIFIKIADEGIIF